MPNGEFDVFGENLGVGIPAAWFDWDSLTALVEATKHLEFDQLFVGWDGKEVAAWDVVASLCEAHGIFFGPSAEGKIKFAQLRMADIRDAATATSVTPLPLQIEQHPPEGEGIDQMRGVIGATPWSDGVPYAASVIGESNDSEPSTALRAAAFNARKTSQINFPTMTWQNTLAILQSMIANRAYGAPVLVIDVTDVGFGVGEFVRVLDPGTTEPYFRDLDGTTVAATDVPKWYGMVLGRTPDYRKGVATLVLLMSNWLSEEWSRLRAPSAQCTAANTGASYPVDDVFVSDEASAFQVGQPVELWRPDGVRRSGTSGAHDIQIIDSISTNTLVLDGAFTTAAQAGDVIRLAPLNDSISGTAEDGSDLPYAGYIAYVFMADTDETLGPNDLDGHVYAMGSP